MVEGGRDPVSRGTLALRHSAFAHGNGASRMSFPLAGLAQLVEQLPCKHQVAGSIPAAGTTSHAPRMFVPIHSTSRSD